MAKISFKAFVSISIFCIASGFCFAQNPPNSLDRAGELYEEFHKTGVIEEAEVLRAIETIQSQLPEIVQSQEQEDLFYLYLRYGLLLSFYYAHGINHFLPVIQEFDAKVDAILKDSSFSADVYLAYADYLNSKLSWSQDAMSIIQTLPILYRRATLPPASEDVRTEALTKLALWYASPANASTPLWNAFIEGHIENIELLSPVDKFMGYITMSMYYMKTYQIEKGWDYLSKAEAIFPNNILNLIIQDNYSRGVFTWG